MKTLGIIFHFILVVMTPIKVLASDDALYTAAPPVDASFVRFIGFDVDEAVPFAGKVFTMKRGEVDAYIPVSSAQLDRIAKGAFYSVLKQPDNTITIVPEGSRDDPTKVLLTLLNGSNQSLSLGVADGSMDVISDINTFYAGHRAVNPIAIELGVFDGEDKTPIAQFDVALRRGQNITFYADAGGVRMIEDRFGANAE